MSNPDGSIIIDAKVEAKQAQSGLNQLEKSSEQAAKTIQKNMDKATASSVRMATAIRTLIRVIPGLSVASLATGLVALITQQKNAKEAADIHAKVLRGLNDEMRSTADIAALVEKNIRNMSEVQLAYAAEKLAGEAKRVEQQMYALLAGMSSASLTATGELDEVSSKLLELRNGIEAGTIDIRDFQKELSNIKQANPALVAQLKNFEDLGMRLYEVSIATGKMAEKERELTQELSFSERITRMAAAANEELRQAMDKVWTAVSPKNAEEAIKFLQNYTRNTYLAQDEQKQLGQETANASMALLAQKAALAILSGDLATAREALAMMTNFQQKLAQVASGEVGRRSTGSRSGKSQVDVIKEIEREIERLGRTGAETLEQKINRGWEAMSQKLTNVQAPLSKILVLQQQYADALNQQAQASRQAYGNEFALNLAKMTGQMKEASAIELGLKLKEIQERMAELGYTADEVTRYQTKFTEAWDKQVNTEHLQEQLEFMKELEQLSGQYGISLEYQNRLIDDQTARYKAAFPELSAYVDQWRQLKLLENDQSYEAGITRAANKFTAEWGNASKIAEKQFDAVISSIQSLGSNVVDAIFGDAELRLDEFAKNIMKMFIEIAMNQAIMKILGFVGVGTAHSGGVAGVSMGPKKMVHPAVFTNAPRYHAGGIAGLASYEVPAILKQGEGIFTPAQMRALSPASETKVYVNIENNVSNAQVSQQSQMDGNGNLNLMVTIDEAVAGRISSGGATAKAIESRYGLKRSGISRG